MVEFETIAKKIGNSIGFVIPKDIVDKVGIKPNETIIIKVKKELQQRVI